MAEALGNNAIARLRSLVERIERLESERKALGEDVKDVYQEAKSAGYDTKVLRQLIRLRKKEPADARDELALLDLYRNALDNQLPLPLTEDERVSEDA